VIISVDYTQSLKEIYSMHANLLAWHYRIGSKSIYIYIRMKI